MDAHNVIHRIGLLIALVFAAPMALSQAESASFLKTAIEAAWQRSPQARTLEAQREEMLASHEAARSWIAGSPSIGLAQRSDRWTGQNGLREMELSVTVPVWLPDQKSARQILALSSSDDLETRIAHARLVLAGEVRERLWAVAAAQEALAEAKDHQQHLEAIADEVMDRVKAGDLARSDGILARQEVLAAMAAVATAQSKMQEASTRYRTLTGQSDIPPPEPEPIADTIREPHPNILIGHTALQRAQATLHTITKIRSDPPSLSLSMQHEVNATAAANRSVGVTIQIPIGTRARNRPLETAAHTQIKIAAAEAAQADAMLRADIELTRQQLTLSQQALEAASARATLTREHTRLIEKAFRIGERGLNDLLRSQTLAHEAEAALRQQRVTAGLAHARVNQALGVLP